MASSPQIIAALVAGVVALVTAAMTTLITVILAERKFRQENTNSPPKEWLDSC